MPEDSNKRPLISKDTFDLWKINPVTVAYIKMFRERCDLLKTGLSSGATLTGNAMETAEATAVVLGEIKGINQLLEAEFEDEKGNIHSVSD